MNRTGEIRVLMEFVIQRGKRDMQTNTHQPNSSHKKLTRKQVNKYRVYH